MSDRSFFSEAILAIVDGDETKLRALLQAHPELVHARADEPHRATLLHYLSANGIESSEESRATVVAATRPEH